MAASKAGSGVARGREAKRRGPRRSYTQAGPVTVRRPNGQTEVQPSYSSEEFNRVVAGRPRSHAR